MAICSDCGNEMMSGASCVVRVLHQDGQTHVLDPHRARPGAVGDAARCGDCGVRPGGLHHIGCDLQRCPRCRGQLITCSCRFDELAAEYDDEIDEIDEIDEAADDVLVVDATGLPVASPDAHAPRRPLPFAAAAAPRRATHHGVLGELTAVHLPTGAPLDLGLAAVLIDLLLDALADRGPSRALTDLLVRRPDVATTMHALHAWCGREQVLIPADAVEHLWALVTWAAATGRLHAAADPLPALLEPLRCGGGLDAAGHPRPADAPAELHCQCTVPFDPTVPPGQIARAVHWIEGRQVVEHVHPPELHEPDPIEAFVPLLRVAERLEREGSEMFVTVHEWQYVGRADRAGEQPALSFYRHGAATRPWGVAVAVDDEGQLYEPKADRRRRAGHRWQRADDAVLLGAAPVRAVWKLADAPYGLRR